MAWATARQVRARSEKAWGRKQQWQPLLSEAYEYALPWRSPYMNSGDGARQAPSSAGQRKVSHRVLDSTLMNDAIKLANRIQSELMPPAQRWADLEPGPFVPPDQAGQARELLQRMAATMFTAMHISGFDTAIAEWLLELCVAGTAVMQVQEREDSLRRPVSYVVPSQASVAIEEGPYGEVWGFYTKETCDLDLIQEKWPDAQISEGLRAQIDEKARAEKSAPPVDLETATIYDAKDDVWRYYVIVSAGDSAASDDLLVKREYAMSRWIVARWMKVPGEIYGRSQVMIALPDAKTLNRVKELLLRNAALSIHGVWTVASRGSVNAAPISLTPGAVIPVRTNGGTNGPEIQRLDVGGDVNMAQFIMADLIQSIHSIMLNASLPDPAGPVRSATEITIRMRELAQDVGAPIARIITEGVIPIMEHTLFALGEMGLVPKPQGDAIRINGGTVNAVFKSQLARGQDMLDVDSMMNAAAIAQQVDPDGYRIKTKTEDFIGIIYEKLGLPKQVYRDAGEVEALKQQMTEMAAAEAGAGAGVPVGAPANGNGGGVPVAA